MPVYYRSLVLILGLLALFQPTLTHAQCHSSPNLSTMDRDFLNHLKSSSDKGKSQIAIVPFYDNQTGAPDEQLYYALPFFIYDSFIEQNPQIRHPYLSFKALEELGLSGEALGEKSSAKKIAEKLKVRYVIYGAFQKTLKDTAKIWINVYDHKKNTSLSPAHFFETRLNDSLLDLVKTGVSTSFSGIGAKGALKSTSTNNPSLVSLRAYGQGLYLARQYNLSQLEMSQIWLEKALKQSFHNYDQAALGLARSYFMMALIQKLSKLDFAPQWLNGLRTLKFVRKQSSKNPLNFSMTYRYVQANQKALEAATAHQAQNRAVAQSHAFDGLKLVPEDGMLQNLYLKTLSKNKDKGLSIDNAICF